MVYTFHETTFQIICRNGIKSDYIKSSCNSREIKYWFEIRSQYVKLKGLLDIEPSRSFNLDETCFLSCPDPEKVLARRGSKIIYKVVNGNDKESITMLFNLNVAVIIAPLFLLFPYVRLTTNVAQNIPKGLCRKHKQRLDDSTQFL